MLPLVFLLVIESLSLLIGEAKRYGKIKGIWLSPTLAITHLFFVDDVVLFRIETLEEWKAYNTELDILCSALGMSIGLENSYFLL